MSDRSSQQAPAFSDDPDAAVPDDALVRARLRMVLASALALVVLIGAYFAVGDDTDNDDAGKQSAELVATGLSAYTERDYPTARRAFLSAIAHDRRNYVAHYNLGLIMQVVDNNPAGAESAYRRALALKPDFGSALFNLGVIRANAGDRDEAKTLYRRAIAADPQLASAHLNLGYLLYEEDPNSAEARVLFDQAATLQPSLANRLPQGLTTAEAETTPETTAP